MYIYPAIKFKSLTSKFNQSVPKYRKTFMHILYFLASQPRALREHYVKSLEFVIEFRRFVQTKTQNRTGTRP